MIRNDKICAYETNQQLTGNTIAEFMEQKLIPVSAFVVDYRFKPLPLNYHFKRGHDTSTCDFNQFSINSISTPFSNSIIKQFASNKDDKRRVEKALDVSGFPSGKNDSLPLNKFQFEDFYNLYKNLTQRSEVEKIFEEL